MSPGRLTLAGLCLLLITPWAGAIPHPYFDDLGFTNWRPTWQRALHEAQLYNKPIYVHLTRPNCPNSARFCKEILNDPGVYLNLNRHYVCYTADYYHPPRDIEQLLKGKGFTEDKTPLHLIVSPNRELMNCLEKSPSAEIFAKTLGGIAMANRFSTPKQFEKEAEKTLASMQSAIKEKDARNIRMHWQALKKYPGWCNANIGGMVVMEIAEEPARKKLKEAARLIRENKLPQTLLALEEARELGKNLIIADEIQQTLNAFKAWEQIMELDRQPSATRLKQQLANKCQQLVTRHPDNTIATLAYLKYRSLVISK